MVPAVLEGGGSLDFYNISTIMSNGSKVHVKPDFLYGGSKDIVCKGGEFYAYWDGEQWRSSISDLINHIDGEVRKTVEEVKEKLPEAKVSASYFALHSSKVMVEFSKYTKLEQQSDAEFNTKILFANDVAKREDYSTTKLDYVPTPGDTPAFDELLGVLYSKPELEKILWFVGALLTNNMQKIQKFMYLYGGKGTGKGTVITILKELFKGYYGSINLRQLTGGSEFATSQVKELPLLIDEDSDISQIKNDTYLLKLTSHEPISVNAKYKQPYETTFNGLLVTASNQRFKVRNIDSGITRRAIVVTPTGERHDPKKYSTLMERVKYEIPAVAQKAIDLFMERKAHYYEDYMDVAMAEATDHVFSFVREYHNQLGDPCTLKRAGELYKLYLEDIGFDTRGYKRIIKNELSRYYDEFHEQKKHEGENYKNIFLGFKKDVAFPERVTESEETYEPVKDILKGLDSDNSPLDSVAADYPAQLATQHGTPKVAWDDCTTTLKDINTRELHYVRIPMNHIVIDFDLKGPDGEKDLERNLEEASKFPPTYMELSKSGRGVHLHYIYDGDVGKLASLYDDDIEIKVFTGKQSLRRKLTKCNDLPITHITTGLPIRKEDGGKVYKDVEIITWNEKKMRTAIKGNLSKKYHDATKPSMDFIAHIFEQAEQTGVKYDLRDMRQDILVFASQSSNNAQYCLKIANQINYCTIDTEEDTQKMQQDVKFVDDKDIVFYDIEVFPNLLVVVWKKYGDDQIFKWINPTPEQIEKLVEHPIVGFNNRRYDNHIIYARLLGEDNLSLYRQSQRIIEKQAGSGFYNGAYELSYADIYEYSSKKQSLKKWEIELGIKHDELELPWDQPVPEDQWERVADYCVNDVMATEATFEATYHDYTARKILATLSGLKVNATTTQHTAKFLFGDDPRPQDKFKYTDLSEMFPGYKYSYGKSEYRGEDPGEGGYVYSEPGVYTDVALLDVASMHPNSLINLEYFGAYSENFEHLVQARIHVKHGELDKAGELFGGQLKPFLTDKDTADQLSYALKIIINIVYGMTSAKFDNKFRHPQNVDNIVAKRGALFMIDLKHAVQEKGYTVAHIKTDSIKIPNADQEIIDFVFEFGKKYGYDFEHEDTYQRMALVNKAVYIAQLEDGSWEAVGAMFAEPYVYKTLFSQEEIVEEDYAITKQTTAPIYLGKSHVGKVARVYASLTGEEMHRVTPEKSSFVTGTKNHRWRLMSDYQGKDDIDMSYYDGLVNDAVAAIEKVGDPVLVIDPFKKDNKAEDITEDDLPF